MWLDLPKKDRWTAPRVQDLAFESVPVISRNGVKVRLYSGSLEGIASPVKNYAPIILADILLEANSSIKLDIPANFTTFKYVLEGNLKVGEENAPLEQDQVGWLDRLSEEAQSELKLTTGASNARVVLYSGLPQNEHMTSHGPGCGNRLQIISR